MDLHFKLVALTVVEDIAELSVGDLIPHLVKLNHIIEPSHFTEQLVVVVVRDSLLLGLLVLDVLPHSPF